MVNERELAVAESYESDGWVPIRGGAPDWLMLKTEAGEITGVKFVEVKSPTGELRYNQHMYRRVLEEELGAEYEVEVVD